MFKNLIRRNIEWHIFRWKVAIFTILTIIVAFVLLNVFYNIKSEFENLDFNSYKIVNDALGKNTRKKETIEECSLYHKFKIAFGGTCVIKKDVVIGYEYFYNDVYGNEMKLLIPKTKDKNIIRNIINEKAIETYKYYLEKSITDYTSKEKGIHFDAKTEITFEFPSTTELKPGKLKLEEYDDVKIKIKYDTKHDQKNYTILTHIIGQYLVDNLSSEFDYEIEFKAPILKAEYKDWYLSDRFKTEKVSDDELYDVAIYKFAHH